METIWQILEYIAGPFTWFFIYVGISIIIWVKTENLNFALFTYVILATITPFFLPVSFPSAVDIFYKVSVIIAVIGLIMNMYYKNKW